MGSTGISQTASASPMTPTGTLTKKIHCHPSRSTSTPPASGTDQCRDPRGGTTRSSRAPRRSAGKIRVMVDSVCGVSRAAPMPCTTRAAISIPMLPCRLHHSDAAVEHRQAQQVEILRPEPVAERPATSSGTAVPEQVGTGHPDDGVVAGAQLVHDRGKLATATMVASTRIIKKPTNIAHKAFHGLVGSTRNRTPPRARPTWRVVSVWNISGRPDRQRFSRRYVPSYAPTSRAQPEANVRLVRRRRRR